MSMADTCRWSRRGTSPASRPRAPAPTRRSRSGSVTASFCRLRAPRTTTVASASDDARRRRRARASSGWSGRPSARPSALRLKKSCTRGSALVVAQLARIAGAMMLLVSLSSMMHRLAILKMLASSWVTRTTVSPSTRLSVRMSSSSSTALTGSRPAEARRGRAGSARAPSRARSRRASSCRRRARRGACPRARRARRAAAWRARWRRWRRAAGRSTRSSGSADVLADGQRAEERARLEHDAERRSADLEVRAPRRRRWRSRPRAGVSRPMR